MSDSIRLRVKWTEQTAEWFRYQGIDTWDEKELLEIRCPSPPITVEDISSWVETKVEGMYYRQTGGQDRVQVQTRSVWKPGKEQQLAWGDHASQHLSDGDTILMHCMAVTEAMGRRMAAQRGPRYTEETLAGIRKQLRFDLNDRVLCFCGPRWLSGHVVGSAVPDEDSLLPYLVKTDPIPGLPSKTISVPSDRDEVCIQEVCFDPESQLHLVKSAATLLRGSERPKLRFAAGDKVACRLRNDPKDGLESWASGTVASLWPELPGELKWEIEEITGMFPSVVAYKVDLTAGGWVYCHRDHHTLIRREGFQPQERVKGISRRMELRKAKDGGKEKVDHQTERSKRMLEVEDDGASSED